LALFGTHINRLDSKYLGTVVRSLGEFNNTAFSHDVTSRQGYATKVYKSIPILLRFSRQLAGLSRYQDEIQLTPEFVLKKMSVLSLYLKVI
jgi:hypothetical protein